MNKSSKNNEKYIKVGLCTFLTLSAVVLVYVSLENLDTIRSFFSMLNNTLQPVLIGMILAYIVSPIQMRIQRFLGKHKMKPNIAKNSSIFLTAFFCLFLCVITIKIICPQVIRTITDLTETMPDMLVKFIKGMQERLQSDNKVMQIAQQSMERFTVWFMNWLNKDIYQTLTQILSSLINVVSFLFNIVIGFIVMIYVLFEKERFRGQAKKMLYAVSKNRSLNGFILDTIRQCDTMFGGFITGKLIDSMIIGCICFICMYILKFPYASLISVMVGVTNIIPFFGPYIGAIPSAFLILLVDPMKCLEFIVFILILQQVDGNIIGPKILGESTGLSPFWVLFSILVFGKLFGIVGMIIGVPLFATIYYVIKRLVDTSLKNQLLPSQTEDYIMLDKINEDNTATFLSNAKRVRKRKNSSEKAKKSDEKQ